jgi:hypothetical protein
MGWDEVIEAYWTHARKYGGLYLFGPPDRVPDVRSAVVQAIGRTADCLLEPGRGTNFDSSFGVPDIRRWARLLTDPRDKKGWPRLFPEPASLRGAMDSVVRGLGGSGRSGCASRCLYAAFLDQAAALIERPDPATVADAYRDLGDRWADVIQLAGRPDITPADLAESLPDLTVAVDGGSSSPTAAAGDYVRIRLGQLDPVQATMAGQMKVTGKYGIAVKFSKMFRTGA